MIRSLDLVLITTSEGFTFHVSHLIFYVIHAMKRMLIFQISIKHSCDHPLMLRMFLWYVSRMCVAPL